MRTVLWRLASIVLLAVAVVGGPALAQESTSEAKPVEGTQGAPSAPSEIQAVIADTKADIAALEEIGRRWQAEDQKFEKQLEVVLESVLLLESQLKDADHGSEEVERIFTRTKPLVRAGIENVRVVLEAAKRPREINSDRGASASSQGLGGSGSSGYPRTEAARELEDLEDRERGLEDELARIEVERRLQSVERSLDLAGRIWDLRLACLHQLSASRKRDVLSLDGEGRDEMDVELEAMRLVLEVQALRLRAVWVAGREGMLDVLGALRLGTLAVKLLALFLLWRWLQANRERYIARARARTAEFDDPVQRQRAQSGVELLAAVAPWGIFLATVAMVRWVLGEEIVRLPGVGPVLLLLTLYGVYRLVSDVAVGLLADSMTRSGIEVFDEFKERLTVRSRWVIRVAMIGALVMSLASLRIGEGVIYIHLRSIIWVLVVVTLFLSLGGLKEQIADLFLATRARGPMARLVRKTRDKFSGRVVAPIAFVWLVVVSVFNLLRGLVYSFESTRAATAYLARRRLQKSAASGGYASGQLENLPPGLVEDLDSTVQIDDLEALDRFSGLETCRRAVALWRQGEAGGSFLLAGDEGVGKRAWVSRFVELENVDLRIEPERRLMNGKALIRWLAQVLLGVDESLTRGQLVSRIEAGPKRIVVIERAERLFLTTVNGYHALAELGPIVDATRHKLFWMVSMGGLAFGHLTAARKDLAFLRRQQRLELWDEQELRALLDHRWSRQDHRIDYSTLISAEGRREDKDTLDRAGRQAYSNLLWDFCGGNPKVGLYYYARSLEPGPDDSIVVRPFQVPNEEELEAIDESALFILAAVARHGSLTPREAARATDYSVGRVQGRLVRLHDLAVVKETAGSFRVTTEWRSTVLRVLRRHNILTV